MPRTQIPADASVPSVAFDAILSTNEPAEVIRLVYAYFEQAPHDSRMLPLEYVAHIISVLEAAPDIRLEDMVLRRMYLSRIPSRRVYARLPDKVKFYLSKRYQMRDST